MNPIDWLLDHSQFLIIIAFALASWVKHRAEQKKAAAEEEAERARRGGMADDGEEEMTGPDWDWQPPAAYPEPPPLPQAPVPMARSAPPPLRVDMAEVDAVLKRQADMQERLRQIKETKAAITTGDAAATRTRVSPSRQPAHSGKSGLRASLRDAGQTRRAVVLREILGPPLGLR